MYDVSCPSYRESSGNGFIHSPDLQRLASFSAVHSSARDGSGRGSSR